MMYENNALPDRVGYSNGGRMVEVSYRAAGKPLCI